MADTTTLHQARIPVPYPRIGESATPPEAPQRSPRRRGGVIAATLIALVLAVGATIAVVSVGDGDRRAEVPTGLRIASATSTALTLVWHQPADAPDRYLVYRNGSEIAQIAGTTTRYVSRELVPGSSYRFSVAAQIGDGPAARSTVLRARTKPGTLAAARIDGLWSVTLRVRSERNFTSISAGERSLVSWRIDGNRLYGSAVGGGDFEMRVHRSGVRVTGKTREALSKCFFSPVSTTVTTRFEVAEAAGLDNAWRATRLTGRIRAVAPYTTSGAFVCPGASYTASLTATRYRV